MGTDAISPLRQRMIEDMSARQLHAATQKSHIRACKRLAAFLKRSPDTATADDIRRFQLHLAESGPSICHRNRTMTGLRFLFRVTLRRLDLAAEIYHIKEPQKIPLVMSADETRRCWQWQRRSRLACCSPSATAVACAPARWFELKAGDSAQGIIRVVQSKGRKDRNVMLSPEMLALLRHIGLPRLMPGNSQRSWGGTPMSCHRGRAFHH